MLGRAEHNGLTVTCAGAIVGAVFARVTVRSGRLPARIFGGDRIGAAGRHRTGRGVQAGLKLRFRIQPTTRWLPLRAELLGRAEHNGDLLGAITGAGFARVTVAVDCPLEFFAVTVSVPPAGIALGAVYKPAEVTVPDTADHDVAPAAVNCSVAPSTTETCVGAITGAGFTRLIEAVDCPLEFLAVTGYRCRQPYGIALGAVYKPVEVTVPDTADHDVAPAAVNC